MLLEIKHKSEKDVELFLGKALVSEQMYEQACRENTELRNDMQ